MFNEIVASNVAKTFSTSNKAPTSDNKTTKTSTIATAAAVTNRTQHASDVTSQRQKPQKYRTLQTLPSTRYGNFVAKPHNNVTHRKSSDDVSSSAPPVSTSDVVSTALKSRQKKVVAAPATPTSSTAASSSASNEHHSRVAAAVAGVAEQNARRLEEDRNNNKNKKADSYERDAEITDLRHRIVLAQFASSMNSEQNNAKETTKPFTTPQRRDEQPPQKQQQDVDSVQRRKRQANAASQLVFSPMPSTPVQHLPLSAPDLIQQPQRQQQLQREEQHQRVREWSVESFSPHYRILPQSEQQHNKEEDNSGSNAVALDLPSSLSPPQQQQNQRNRQPLLLSPGREKEKVTKKKQSSFMLSPSPASTAATSMTVPIHDDEIHEFRDVESTPPRQLYHQQQHHQRSPAPPAPPLMPSSSSSATMETATTTTTTTTGRRNFHGAVRLLSPAKTVLQSTLQQRTQSNKQLQQSSRSASTLSSLCPATSVVHHDNSTQQHVPLMAPSATDHEDDNDGKDETEEQEQEESPNNNNNDKISARMEERLKYRIGSVKAMLAFQAVERMEAARRADVAAQRDTFDDQCRLTASEFAGRAAILKQERIEFSDWCELARKGAKALVQRAIGRKGLEGEEAANRRRVEDKSSTFAQDMRRVAEQLRGTAKTLQRCCREEDMQRDKIQGRIATAFWECLVTAVCASETFHRECFVASSSPLPSSSSSASSRCLIVPHEKRRKSTAAMVVDPSSLSSSPLSCSRFEIFVPSVVFAAVPTPTHVLHDERGNILRVLLLQSDSNDRNYNDDNDLLSQKQFLRMRESVSWAVQNLDNDDGNKQRRAAAVSIAIEKELQRCEEENRHQRRLLAATSSYLTTKRRKEEEAEGAVDDDFGSFALLRFGVESPDVHRRLRHLQQRKSEQEASSSFDVVFSVASVHEYQTMLLPFLLLQHAEVVQRWMLCCELVAQKQRVFDHIYAATTSLLSKSAATAPLRKTKDVERKEPDVLLLNSFSSLETHDRNGLEALAALGLHQVTQRATLVVEEQREFELFSFFFFANAAVKPSSSTKGMDNNNKDDKNSEETSQAPRAEAKAQFETPTKSNHRALTQLQQQKQQHSHILRDADLFELADTTHERRGVATLAGTVAALRVANVCSDIRLVTSVFHDAQEAGKRDLMTIKKEQEQEKGRSQRLSEREVKARRCALQSGLEFDDFCRFMDLLRSEVSRREAAKRETQTPKTRRERKSGKEKAPATPNQSPASFLFSTIKKQHNGEETEKGEELFAHHVGDETTPVAERLLLPRAEGKPLSPAARHVFEVLRTTNATSNHPPPPPPPTATTATLPRASIPLTAQQQRQSSLLFRKADTSSAGTITFAQLEEVLASSGLFSAAAAAGSRDGGPGSVHVALVELVGRAVGSSSSSFLSFGGEAMQRTFTQADFAQVLSHILNAE